MSAWFRRFGLHLAAAVGATGIFVAAAAVGASQTRQQAAECGSTPAAAVWTRTPRCSASRRSSSPRPPARPPTDHRTGGRVRRRRGRRAATATPPASTAPTAPAQQVVPERSLAGSISAVSLLTASTSSASAVANGGQSGPGPCIRLNGKAARLEALAAGRQSGDSRPGASRSAGQTVSGPRDYRAPHLTSVRYDWAADSCRPCC